MSTVDKFFTAALLSLSLFVPALQASIATIGENRVKLIDLSFNGTPIEDVYQMLSLQNNINIVLSDQVSGSVSLNLYGVTVENAIRSIAESSGYVAEKRGDTFAIVLQEAFGKDAVSGNTDLRSYKIQYADIATVHTLVTGYLSRYGKISMIENQRLLIIEDLPDFLQKIEKLITMVDREPRQILIEAKILEITLRHDENFGIDWSATGGDGSVGTKGFASTTASGFFLDILTPDVNIFLNSLAEDGRVRTLSTPKLLVLENQEAEVVIGDRIGYKVTSTINQVTTESIEFLESGVILKVTASVDSQNRILLSVHPEVSTATVTDGIPSLATTEVTTQLLANDGQNILIAGLIKRSVTQYNARVPVLGEIPGIGGLFSSDHLLSVNTETILLITPTIVKNTTRNNYRTLDSRLGTISESIRIDNSSVFSPGIESRLINTN